MVQSIVSYPKYHHLIVIKFSGLNTVQPQNGSHDKEDIYFPAEPPSIMDRRLR